MRAIVGSFFAAFGLYLLVTQGIDPGIGNAFVSAFGDIAHNVTATLSAHPLEAVLVSAVAIEPLAVGTKTAWQMMGISNAHGYKLVEQGEIDSYLEGRVRKVTVASIKAYIERKLAAARKDAGPVRTEKATLASMASRAKRRAEGTPRRARTRTHAPAPAAAPAPIAAEEATPTT
jgi:hypothetical protein